MYLYYFAINAVGRGFVLSGCNSYIYISEIKCPESQIVASIHKVLYIANQTIYIAALGSHDVVLVASDTSSR